MFVFALAISFLICGGTVAATFDTLIVAVPADIISTDPARYTEHGLTETVQHLIYRRVLSVREGALESDGGQLVPVDEVTWEITLNEGVNTHAGTPVTPTGYAAYLRRMTADDGIGGYPAPARTRLYPVQRVDATDRGVRLHLDAPWPGIAARLAAEPIAVLDRSGANVVGTGPFRVERWDRGNRVILQRAEPSETGIERIQFEVVPSAEERLRLVLDGDVHIALELPPGGLWQLRRSENAKAVTVPRSRVHFVEFNVSVPPFSDMRVRKALNLAIDMREMIRRVAQQEAEPIATILSPVTLGYDPTVPAYGYDPAEARRLLREAGYPNGFSFELDTTRTRLSWARIYQEMLRAVGIDVTLRVWDTWSALREQILYGRRQAWLGEWGNSSLDPGSAIRPKLHSEGEANYGGYSDPVLDAMLSEADAILDPETRLRRYGDIQRYIRETVPMLFGYVEYDVYGAVKELPWNPGPNGWLRLDEIRIVEAPPSDEIE